MITERMVEEQSVEEDLGGRAVSLEIPAEAHFLRLARLAAVDVGARAGLTVDETDDLRIAVDELCYALLGGASRVTLKYRVAEDAVRIDGSSDGDRVEPANDVTRAILAAVVDECEISSADGRPRFRASKRIPSAG